jgi:hypothetical protein
MATRSLILREKEEGEYEALYCHSDGYLTHNGAILLDHYSERERVDELFKRGDLSYLAPIMDPEKTKYHSYDNPCSNVCVFYGRDRGYNAEDTAPFKCTLEEIDKDPLIEYAYIFDKNNTWKYFEVGDFKKDGLKSLKTGLDNLFKEWGFPRPIGMYGWYSNKEIELFKNRYESFNKKDSSAEQEKSKQKETERNG